MLDSFSVILFFEALTVDGLLFFERDYGEIFLEGLVVAILEGLAVNALGEGIAVDATANDRSTMNFFILKYEKKQLLLYQN